jgi:low temperature requirement protein LtrA
MSRADSCTRNVISTFFFITTVTIFVYYLKQFETFIQDLKGDTRNDRLFKFKYMYKNAHD